MRSRSSVVLVAFLAAVLVALGGTAGGTATERVSPPLREAAAPPAQSSGGVLSPDRALGTSIDTHLAQGRIARSAVSWIGGETVASTGETVLVYVSIALPPELGTPQTWADFLASLDHGSELSSLTAYIATFAEMQEICGKNALGCYGGDKLLSMGESVQGVTAAEVVRHEYAHHIAFHRLNPPWQAIDWGTKRWATAEDVCRRVAGGTVYPGDEEDHYGVNPGEAWAETYRLLEERKAGDSGSGWRIVDPSFYPDETSLDAASRDVLQPWTSPTTRTYGYRFTPKGKKVWTIRISAPLDGSLVVRASLPRNGLQRVALLAADAKTVLATGIRTTRSVRRIEATVCGRRSLLVRVTQSGAYGRVVVVTSTP